jgi:hypothetical protein
MPRVTYRCLRSFSWGDLWTVAQSMNQDDQRESGMCGFRGAFLGVYDRAAVNKCEPFDSRPSRAARSAREVRRRAASDPVGLGVSRCFALKGLNESTVVRLDFDLLPLERCDFFWELSNRRQTVTQ